MDVEISTEVLQNYMADRLPLSRLKKLCPESAELFVRNRGKDRIRQSPPAHPRSLLKVTSFRVASIEIEKVQESILIEVVFDICIHHLTRFTKPKLGPTRRQGCRRS